MTRVYISDYGDDKNDGPSSPTAFPSTRPKYGVT